MKPKTATPSSPFQSLRRLLSRRAPLTLARDINIGLLTLITAVFALVILFGHLRATDQARQRQIVDAQRIFEHLRTSIGLSLWTFDLRETRLLAESFFQDRRVVTVRVRQTEEGQPLVELVGGKRNEVLQLTGEVGFEGEQVGYLQVEVSFTAYREQLQARLGDSITTALVVLLAIGVFTGLLVKWFLQRPIEALLHGVDEYARGNYAYRFSGVRQLELVKVITRVQEMALQVAQREQSLRSSNLRLEQQIVERRLADEALQLLQQLLANVINSLPFLLVTIDGEARVMQWNRQAENWTGVAPEEAEGRDIFALLPALNRNRQQMLRLLHQGAGEGHIRLDKLFGQSERRYEMEVRPLIGAAHGGAVVRIEDVSERLRLQETMVQAEKMSTIGGLAAGMAHEVNNPLAVIMQHAELLQQRISADGVKNRQVAEQHQLDLAQLRGYFEARKVDISIHAIREAAGRANGIVTNMLGFSRKGVARMEQQRLQGLVESTLELAAKDFDAGGDYDFRQIELVRHYAPGLPEIPCRASQIQQVLLNLFKNGAEAMAHAVGGEPPTLEIGIYPEDDDLRLEIADNGPGMDEATRRRIFEPFFTTREGAGGTGLGLAVSYFIITETHGGSMEVESAPGEGTRFIIHLPLEGPRRENGEDL